MRIYCFDALNARTFVTLFVKAEELCKGLMFDLNLDIDLPKVKNDITNTLYSFSLCII